MGNKTTDVLDMVTEPDEDGFVFNSYTDGTRQWFTTDGSQRNLFIENLPEYGTRYYIVDRGDGHETEMFPPKLSGPFEDLDAAKAAYKLMYAALLTQPR